MARIRNAGVEAVVLAALTFVAPVVASGQGPRPEFQLNSYTTHWQANPQVAATPNGSFVAVWHSYGQDGSGWGVFGRQFNPAGWPGAEFQVSAWTTQAQLFPAVATDSGGNFVVVWEDEHRDGDGFGIFGQRFDATGMRVGAEFQVNAWTTSFQRKPDVAYDGLGNFVVAWTSYDQDGQSWGVFARRYAAAVGAFGPEFQVNAYTTGGQETVAVAADATGGFTVVWESESFVAGERSSARARRFSASGIPVTDEVQVNTDATEPSAKHPGVASVSDDGSFVVVWRGHNAYGYAHVVGRRFSTIAGGSFGPVFTISAPGAWPWDPSIAAGPSGGFVVAWENGMDKDGDGLGIFARRYDRAGVPAGDEFQVNAYTTGSQTAAAVATAGDGRFMVAWHDPGQDGSGHGAFARAFDDLIFADGFDSGGLSRWSLTRMDGGDLDVAGSAGLAGTDVGLRGVVDDAAGLYVQDHSHR